MLSSAPGQCAFSTVSKGFRDLGFRVLGVDSDGSSARVHKGSGLRSLGLGFRV